MIYLEICNCQSTGIAVGLKGGQLKIKKRKKDRKEKKQEKITKITKTKKKEKKNTRVYINVFEN